MYLTGMRSAVAKARKRGPLCQIKNPVVMDDGTLCRCTSPLPGVIGQKPEMHDNFVWPIGVDVSKPLGEEAWFEQRYPNLLENFRLKAIEKINTWVQSYWGNSSFHDHEDRNKVRERVYARDRYVLEKGLVKKNDNQFERCGDRPQTAKGAFNEADVVLGSFVLDIETPVTINYSSRSFAGKTIHAFEWTAIMYVEDSLGLEKNNNIVHKVGSWILPLAPSRRVKRARWKIHGKGNKSTI